MKTKNVKPTPAPAREIVVVRRDIKRHPQIEPVAVQVIDFYPLPPSQKRRQRD